jgi:5-methylthioadenosine/S-adenosylhomocysteine deaminase
MGAALAAGPSLVGRLDAAHGPATGQDRGTLEPAAREPVNAARHIVSRGGTILTMDPAVGDFAKGDLHIQGKHIVAVGRDLKVPAGAQVTDAADTIIIPGFVDCHRHSWSAQFRRLVDESRGYLFAKMNHTLDILS